MKTTPRDLRLLNEFKAMKALRSPHCLFDFRCADLSAEEGLAFSMRNITTNLIEGAWPGFLRPEEFEQRYRGQPPEKYLIRYACIGLEQSNDGSIIERNEHFMEVVFGWRYPAEQPSFLWLTPIWHPNFKKPYICIQGRPFAVGLTLAQITTEVGRMIQYQNYNVKDPLNREAEAWARQHAHLFPVDDRDILDSRRKIGGRRKSPIVKEELLIELIEPESDEADSPHPLVELVETDEHK